MSNCPLICLICFVVSASFVLPFCILTLKDRGFFFHSYEVKELSKTYLFYLTNRNKHLGTAYNLFGFWFTFDQIQLKIEEILVLELLVSGGLAFTNWFVRSFLNLINLIHFQQLPSQNYIKITCILHSVELLIKFRMNFYQTLLCLEIKNTTKWQQQLSLLTEIRK